MESELERREREHREDLARLRGLRPIDDDFMRCIFKDNIPLAQRTLRIITEKDDLVITSVETQKDMKRLVGARSICLDAYGRDSQGKLYDLEIQRADRGAGVHRARYHSSAMDVENLNAGQSFDELPETYTIFITEHDLKKKGLPFYHVERVYTETDELFGDGEHIIYVNGEYRGDSDIGKLMHDFCCWDPNQMLLSEFRDVTRYYKETEKGVTAMCKVMEDMRNTAWNEGRIEGRIEGIKENAIETAKNLLKRGKCTLEEIAEDTQLTLEQVKELAGA